MSQLWWDGSGPGLGAGRASCQHQGNVLAMDAAGENRGFKRSHKS